jgi:carbon-monoxide dehydrogenase medium subunit
VTARSLDEALALIASGNAQVIAGGTDLLVERKMGSAGPALLVDVSRVPELKGIRWTDAGLEIGAATTHTEIARCPLVASSCPVLAEAARAIGAIQTRNLGTIGGNLVTCVPSMDSGPALLALDASVRLASRGRRRRIPLASFFLGPRKTALMPGELLASIIVPSETVATPTCFLKFGLRKGQALALVNVAAGFSIDPVQGTVRAPRIALGAVAPTVMRAPSAEAYLAGRPWTLDAAAEAARIAATEARPIDDFRASAAYRRKLIAVLTRRALEEVWRRMQRQINGVAA